MIFAGIQKLSLIDYPDKISAVVFSVGCNFDCLYCHNRELICKGKVPKSSIISEEEIFNFLSKRRGRIDALTISGGEPTLHKDLPEFIAKIKDLGFLVKLDTNGTNPKMLKGLIDEKLIDYVAMDIKAPLNWEEYQSVVRINNRKIFEQVLRSIKILTNDFIEYEFRTSLVQGMLSKNNIKEIVGEIKNGGVYYLQNFVNPDKQEFDEKDKIMYNKLRSLNIKELQGLRDLVEEMGQRCEIRN